MEEKVKATDEDENEGEGEGEDNSHACHSKKLMGEDSYEENISHDEENKPRLFPDAFYCPITNELFEHPVVVRDGDSYEISAVEGDHEPASLYENRALLEIMKKAKENLTDTTSDTNNNLVASLRNIQKNLKTSFSNLVDRSVFNVRWLGPLPDAYYCPITLDLMHDPVIDRDGTTYERRAIVKWVRVNGQSPFTRNELMIEDLYPNNVIMDIIHSELEKSDESMHHSIRKWKTDHEKQQQQASARDGLQPRDENESNDDDDDYNPFELPVTEEQIEERRRLRQRNLRHKAAFCAAIIVLLACVPYVSVMVSLVILLGCIITCKRSDT